MVLGELLGFLALLGTLPCGPQDRCLLRPDSPLALRKHLQGVADLHIESIDAGEDRTVIRTCDPQGSCRETILTSPFPDCPGRTAGAICVLPSEDLPEETTEALVRALEGIPGDRLWMAAPVARSSHDSAADPGDISDASPAEPDPSAIPSVVGTTTAIFSRLVALGEVLVPLLVGWLTGAAIRRGRRQAVGLATKIGTGVTPPLLVAAIYPSTIAPLGLWDALFMAMLLGIGGLFGVSHGATSVAVKRAIRATASTLVIWMLLEGACRLWLPRPPERNLPSPSVLLQASTRSQTKGLVHRFQMLDSLQAHSGDPGPRCSPVLVLHSGNSVVEGAGAGPGRAFVNRIEVRLAGQQHLNAGVPGAGADLGFVLLRNWLAQRALDGFVLYLHPNYPWVQDLPYRACENRPLLEYLPEGPTPICRDLRQPGALPASRSPAPYALEVAGHDSAAIAYLDWIVGRRLWPLERWDVSEEVSATRLKWLVTTMLRETRDAGVPMAIVLIPGRPQLEGDLAEASRYQRLRDIVRGLPEGHLMPVVDLLPTLEEAVQREGTDSLFLDRCCHLSGRGHQIVADRLLEDLKGFFDDIVVRWRATRGVEPLQQPLAWESVAP